MHVYGPVPSRRLGNSLGVDIIPNKVCSYSCVYCQLGRTLNKLCRPQSFYPREEIIEEIAKNLQSSNPDYITIVGDGEPTLSSDLGWIIDECKNRWSVPVAAITNGSLLHRREVRENLLNADIVMPSLDAADGNTFRKINRPHGKINYDDVVDGLITFSKMYTGTMRLEVMLVDGVNDSESHLYMLKEIIDKINPDIVDISIPTRPPAEKWVNPPPLNKILLAIELLKGTGIMTNKEYGNFGLANFKSVLEAIRQLSSRHPLRLSQAEEIERLFSMPGELNRLIKEGHLRKKEYNGELFILSDYGVTDPPR
jgi:wyosine [tRNA(Phe)-imidazoG37] synthetase (radical SAM superfamily)